MRTAFVLCCLATSAPAWEFVDTPLCTVRDVQNGVEVTVTYDPTQPLYAIRLSQFVPWPAAQTFGLTFADTRPIAISTGQHVLTDGGRTLTVTDTGFGNVLDGMAFNPMVTVTMDAAPVVTLSLDGAAGPINRLRSCGDPLTG